ncbi:hypothetical protein [Paraburkholderia sp. SG-MS1]|uniref:hypothetical protein n=1 Tax=Paraburkholderia sp. SG-MS1 TaxID=2023741 RepID=UPI0015810380|nr:hypothetical protein [Paraburkholderia sp. SG-MS1]
MSPRDNAPTRSILDAMPDGGELTISADEESFIHVVTSVMCLDPPSHIVGIEVEPVQIHIDRVDRRTVLKCLRLNPSMLLFADFSLPEIGPARSPGSCANALPTPAQQQLENAVAKPINSITRAGHGRLETSPCCLLHH